MKGAGIAGVVMCALLAGTACAEDDQIGQLLEDRKLPATVQSSGPERPAEPPRRPQRPEVQPRPSLLLPPAPLPQKEEGPEPDVDTSGLWFHLRQGNPEAARSDLARLRRQNPGWSPPEDLLLALSAPTPVTAPVPPRGGRAATDPAAGAERRGWQALSAGKPEQARDWFGRATKTLSAREGLGRALVALDDGKAVRELVEDDPRLGPALAEAALGRALEGVDRGDRPDLIMMRLMLATDLGRPDAWETAGWRWLGRDQAALALEAFTRAGPVEGARFGRVLAARTQGDGAEAEALACDAAKMSARLAQACGDALAGRQLTAYQAGEFSVALRLGEEIAALPGDWAGPEQLRGWSLFRLGRPAEAAELFSRLYDAGQSPQLAAALAQSLTAAGRGEDLRRRAAAGDRLLMRIVQAQAGATAWGRKQFDLAARYADALSADNP
ncbi:tetratricopeptide repeat protein [Novispirillum itersonii]|uniref:hypothetical protein n=1 Tax=Novispirillum itersonii TaxID=189 RepID=UPI00037A1129|nr:hypothetical protein [Novispirillum itersonii]